MIQTKTQTASARVVSKQMFRLLPTQVVLAAVGAVNGIVSSIYAANFVGVDAMGVVGLYGPVQLLLGAISLMISSGSVILYGQYAGQNRPEKGQSVFSLNLALTSLLSAALTGAFLLLALWDRTGFLCGDERLRPLFNAYLLGQSAGVFPLVVGNQLPAFLAMENKGKRTTSASLAYIGVNLALNHVFVRLLRLEALGLALSNSLGLWVFFLVEAQYYLSGKSHLRISAGRLPWGETAEILKTGFPGAAATAYQTLRGYCVNRLLLAYVGSVGVSAFAAANNLLGIFWAIPAGMLAVSRMMLSVSNGEEDRKTLTDVMRVMFGRFLPLMGAVCALLIVFAVPLTRLFYRDPSESVFAMTVWGLRLLPVCMPLAIICTHFVCYGQIAGRQGLVHLVSALDGVVCVAGFTALLIRAMGMNSVYLANILNGVVCVLVVLGFAVLKNRRIPRSMDELMVIPEGFGVPDSERMDLSVNSMEEVVSIAERVQSFCLERGVDARRALLAGLALEEMAGNVVAHGFVKDDRDHSVDVRVVHKDEDVILRLRDDCVPFDPEERRKIAENEDPARNIGIRMVFRMARNVQYQNILGMNVLTIRI